MSQKYYVRFRGRVLGPMSPDRMRDLIQRGQVTRMHELSSDGLQWKKSEEFTELYPSSKKVEVVSQTHGKDTEQIVDSEPADIGLQPKQPVAEWYANINGEPKGPVSEEMIQNWCKSNAVTPETMVWIAGMKDWVEAQSLRPEWFQQSNVAAAKTAVSSSASSAITSDDVSSIVAELQSRRSWIFVTAITALVFAVIQVVGMVFILIGQFVAPAETGGQAIFAFVFGVIFLSIGVLGIVAFVNLLQYGSALTVLHYAPTSENLLRSLKKLSAFWFFAGLSVSSSLLVISITVLISYANGLRILYLLGK